MTVEGAHAAGESRDLVFEVREGIGVITLNRPQARNALTLAMYDGLAEICRAAPEDPAIKVLVIKGAGGQAFAAGTDISSFRNMLTADEALAYERRIDGVLSAVECCPLPVIAALAGACTGGGGGIAAASDLRIAAADLKFGFPIARTLGNCLSNASLSRLVALIGSGRTREMLFTARLVGAEEALAIGLVSEVLESFQAVEARGMELARTISGYAPLTLRATKEALRRLRVHRLEAGDEDLITLCYTSEDFREGQLAFLEKRPPRWKGK